MGFYFPRDQTDSPAQGRSDQIPLGRDTPYPVELERTCLSVEEESPLFLREFREDTLKQFVLQVSQLTKLTGLSWTYVRKYKDVLIFSFFIYLSGNLAGYIVIRAPTDLGIPTARL